MRRGHRGGGRGGACAGAGGGVAEVGGAGLVFLVLFNVLLRNYVASSHRIRIFSVL